MNQTQASIMYEGVEVIITRSAGIDGAIVIFIDTDETVPEGLRGPEIRVMVNDSDVFMGKEYESADDGSAYNITPNELAADDALTQWDIEAHEYDDVDLLRDEQEGIL